MLASLVNQALKERSRTYLALSLGLAVYVAVIMAIYKAIPSDGAFAVALANINRGLFWTVDSPAGLAADWFNLTSFAVVLPILVVAAGVLHARRWITGCNNADHLAFLLSYPLSRRQMIFNVLLLQIIFLLMLTASSAAALLIGVISGLLPVQPLRIIVVFNQLWVFSLFFNFVTILAGNLTGNRWMGVVITVGIFLLGIVLYFLPSFTPMPSALRWISPLTPFIDGNPLDNGIKLTNWLAMMGWTIAAGVAAWSHFDRLDLSS